MSRKNWGYERSIAVNTRADVRLMPAENGYIAPLKRERTNAAISEFNPYRGLTRNNGARKAKKYVASDHPGGAEMTGKRVKPSRARMNARRKARRAAKQEEYARMQNAAGLNITTERAPSERGGMIATDYTHMVHAAMKPDSQAHRDFHDRRGIGRGGGDCK